MKKIFSLAVLNLFCLLLLSQPRITITADGNKSELLGFVLESTNSSSGKISEDVIISKTAGNGNTDFRLAHFSGKIFANVRIDVYDASSSTPSRSIVMKNVNVESYKQYTGTYSGSAFNNSGGSAVYEDVSFKLQGVEIIQNSASSQNQNNDNRQPEKLQNKTTGETVEGGYESVHLIAHLRNDEDLQVKINGRTIATYTKDSDVYIDEFLKPHSNNIISFIFNAEAKGSDVEILGKFPGGSTWNSVFNFRPKAGKTETQFELPFAVKKK